MAANPTVLRRQLGAELRRLREGTRHTVAAAADELGWSESKLSRIETANIGIRRPDLDRLLAFYDVSEIDRERLRGLAAQSRQRAWWEGYGDALSSAYEQYISYEASAAAIYNFEAQVIPGLVQTAEYAKAVTEIHLPNSPQVVENRVGIRMARQAVLIREPNPRFWAVIDEAALRRPIGGPDVMRRQIVRLIEEGDRPMITIQILPFSAGVHRGLAGSFVVMEFERPDTGPVVYCEGMTGGLLSTKAGDMRNYRENFEAIAAVSLSTSDSLQFLRALARGEH